MATVSNTIKLPDGTSPSYAAVVIELVASTTSRGAGWITASDTTILSVARPAVTAGAWTASLTPNADITPSGTVYKVTETADKVRYIHYIEVGFGGGSVFDLLVDPPASIASAALSSHIDDTSGAHAASAISVTDTAGYFAGATTEAVLAEIGLALNSVGSDSHPTLTYVGKVSAGNSPATMAVNGRYLYATVFNDNKVKVFDIDDRDVPVQVGEVTTGSGPSWIAARGKYVFVLNQNAGTFQSIDVSNPASPSIAQTLTTRAGQRFALNGRYALCGGPESGGSANTWGLIDIASPTSMSEVGTVVSGTVHRDVVALTPGYFAAVSRDTNTLLIIDATTPASPAVVASVSSLTQTLTPLLYRAPYVYAMAYGDAKLYVVDVTVPSAPVRAGSVTLTTTGIEQAVFYGDRYLITACRTPHSIDVVDIANPASPKMISTLDVSAAARTDRIVYSNGRLYLSEQGSTGWIHVVEIHGGKAA